MIHHVSMGLALPRMFAVAQSATLGSGVTRPSLLMECDISPCENNGSCAILAGSYICTCPFNYNGLSCQNPGECSEVYSSVFVCVCMLQLLSDNYVKVRVFSGLYCPYTETSVPACGAFIIIIIIHQCSINFWVWVWFW